MLEATHGYVLLLMVSAVVSATCAGGFFFVAPERVPNRLAALLLGGACFWALCSVAWNVAPDPESALFWVTPDSKAFFAPANGELERYAVWKDGWKLARQSNESFQARLYELDLDPSETVDLGAIREEIVEELETEYRDWRRRESEFSVAVAVQVGDVERRDSGFDFGQGGGWVGFDQNDLLDFADSDFSFQCGLVLDSGDQLPQMIASHADSWELSVEANQHLVLKVWNPAGELNTLRSRTPLAANRLQDVAFTSFGWRNSPSRLRPYLDGKLQIESKKTQWPRVSDENLRFGNRLSGDAPLRGSLIGPRFYRVALNAKEIRATAVPEPAAESLQVLCVVLFVALRQGSRTRRSRSGTLSMR